MSIKETLDDRESKYGDFGTNAAAMQAFKNVYRSAPGWAKMTAVQRETLDMIITKTCRLLYGDPLQQIDTWHDIGGYAVLATEEFAKARAQKTSMAPPPPAPEHPRDLDTDPAPLFLDKAPKK